MSPRGGVTISIIIQKIIFILVQKGSREALSLHNHHHPSQSCAMGSNILLSRMYLIPYTLESGIDVGQGISVGPGKFVKKNKCPM